MGDTMPPPATVPEMSTRMLIAPGPLSPSWNIWDRVSGFGFRVSGFGFRVSVFGFWVSGFGFRFSGFGSQVSGSGFQVSGFGFRVRVWAFEVQALGCWDSAPRNRTPDVDGGMEGNMERER
jgi:hypothetical protein